MTISKETFFLGARFQGTLQSQIREMIVQGVLSGRFRPREKMPSSRGLAQHLGVSRLTVTLAYQELIADEYLCSENRSGYYVSENAPSPPQTNLQSYPSNIDWPRMFGKRFSGIASVEKPNDWTRYKFPFIYGQTDEVLFDHKNWRLCALQALGRRDFSALVSDYGTRDDPKLVDFLIRHTLPRRGILANTDEVLITSGAQNALWLTAQILLNQRRSAVFEEPCYPGLRNILDHVRCNIMSLKVDSGGLPVDTLPPDTDVIFTTPSHQCPTNATMPIERRKTLLASAEKNNFLIVEDDYEFEMSFLKATTPALKSLDYDGRVIYLGSFSKSLFPGLRLGYLVGPSPFIEEARALRATIMRHIPGHIQRTTAYFLAKGHYNALIRRIRIAFMERRTLMDKAIRENELTIAGAPNFGGSAFWMQAPENVNTNKIAQKAREQGILIEPGAPFFAENGPNCFYRLAYSSIQAERIEKGISKLAAIINASAASRDRR